jgi:hypothetical protein
MRRHRPARRSRRSPLKFLAATLAAGATLIALAFVVGGCRAQAHREVRDVPPNAVESGHPVGTGSSAARNAEPSRSSTDANATNGAAASSTNGTFSTPEQAVDALVASADDPSRADQLLGPDGPATLECVQDAAAEEGVADGNDVTVAVLIDEGVSLQDAGPDVRIVLIGNDSWALPTPLVRDGSNHWRFDAAAGADEARCREIGYHELRAIATLRELVDAQLDYRDMGAATSAAASSAPAASAPGSSASASSAPASAESTSATPDSTTPQSASTSPAAFAARWVSTPGQRDGLFWESKEGEPQSPIGPDFCAGEKLEAVSCNDPSCSAPCHGYVYRILTAQGPHVASGEASYLDENGRLTQGVAFVAWPAEYGQTGVMTFVANQLGLVFQKDLGPSTPTDAAAIRAYDPDETWTLVKD